MDKIVLKDQTEYEILEGASLDAIKIEVSDFNKIKEISDSFTKENLKEVKFKVNDDVTGNYTNLILTNISFVTKTVEETGTDSKDTTKDDEKTSESEVSTESTEEVSDETTTTYVVTISLRESTEIEVRLAALEEKTDALDEGHIANADAIEGILTDVIPAITDTEAE